MKLLNSIFLLLAASVVTVSSDSHFKCPKSELLQKKGDTGCICSDTFIMTCTKIGANWIENFEPDEMYILKTLEIIDSPNLPYIADKFHSTRDKKTGIKAITLIFTLSSAVSAAKIPDHFMNTLLAVASDAITIKSANPFVLDKLEFPSTLKTISLTNVQVTNTDESIFENLNLETLKLNKVSFGKQVDTLFIKNPSRVEITECKSLAKKLNYVPPSDCSNDKEIVLNLQNNEDLDDLIMDKMFDDPKCKYYVDLSESKLTQDFLKNKKALFSKIKSPSPLFIILRDVKLNCYDCVHAWYTPIKPFIHSVQCSNYENKYLDQIHPTDITKKPLPKC